MIVNIWNLSIRPRLGRQNNINNIGSAPDLRQKCVSLVLIENTSK